MHCWRRQIDVHLSDHEHLLIKRVQSQINLLSREGICGRFDDVGGDLNWARVSGKTFGHDLPEKVLLIKDFFRNRELIAFRKGILSPKKKNLNAVLRATGMKRPGSAALDHEKNFFSGFRQRRG